MHPPAISLAGIAKGSREMATTALINTATRPHAIRVVDLRGALVLVGLTGLPVGLFGLVNLAAEAFGILPMFFSPFGLPGWAGGAVHLMQLALLGAAFWALHVAAAPRSPKLWLATLIGAYIALPFLTPPLDSLQLSLLCTSLFLLALATIHRVGKITPLAGWLISPMLVVVGVSATMGLVLTAAYTPPFALIQGQNPAPPPAA